MEPQHPCSGATAFREGVFFDDPGSGFAGLHTGRQGLGHVARRSIVLHSLETGQEVVLLQKMPSGLLPSAVMGDGWWLA